MDTLHPNTAVWQAELEKVLRRMHRMVHDPGPVSYTHLTLPTTPYV